MYSTSNAVNTVVITLAKIIVVFVVVMIASLYALIPRGSISNINNIAGSAAVIVVKGVVLTVVLF